MTLAELIGAAQTLILEEDGSAQIRDMESGQQRDIDLASAAEELAQLAGPR